MLTDKFGFYPFVCIEQVAWLEESLILGWIDWEAFLSVQTRPILIVVFYAILAGFFNKMRPTCEAVGR